MNTTTANPLLTQDDLAAWLGVSTWSIWNMRKKGLLPEAVRLGRSLRWRPEVIEQWILDRERPAADFDPVFCKRADAARKGREAKKCDGGAVKKMRGRPSKQHQVESR